MKTRNFPERKNQRRIKARARWENLLYSVENDYLRKGFYPDWAASIRGEIAKLDTLIVDSARAVRSKKRRAGPRKLGGGK